MDGGVDIEKQVPQSTLREIQKAAGSDEDCPDVCVICLEQITEKAEAIPCRHTNFDFICLANWLENAPSCPLCMCCGYPWKRISNLSLGKTTIRALHYQWTSPTEFRTFVIKASSLRKTEASSPGASIHRLARPRVRREPVDEPLQSRLARRREVYQKQLFALHVGSNSFSGYQELNPSDFVQDEELIIKAKSWIRRELRVFDFLQGGAIAPGSPYRRPVNPEFLLQYIVALLKTVDLKGSDGRAEEMLRGFLGQQNTRIFLQQVTFSYDSVLFLTCSRAC